MTAPERITRGDAQAQISGLKVAEILIDFSTNFLGVYPDSVLSRAVGPDQSMIGLAIKRGHLILATPAALAASPEVQALVMTERERCARIAEAQSQSNNPYISGLAMRIAAAIRAGTEGQP